MPPVVMPTLRHVGPPASIDLVNNVDDRAEKLRDEAFLKEPEEFRRCG
jgi:hypothetical protein